jgi:phosphopantetheinyl transferase
MKVYDLAEVALRPAPQAADVYLVRLPELGRGPTAQATLRRALLKLLRGWYGESVELVETGPAPTLTVCPLKCSISYDGTDGWVALGAQAKLGCDAVLAQDFPEMLAVARKYLGPDVAERIEQSRLRAETFAHAWAKHEATLKAMGWGLAEAQVVPAMLCHYHRQTQAVVAVVTE